jgi:hypothetical protein
VELLDLDPSLGDDTALIHHFNELAAFNETQDVAVMSESAYMGEDFMPGIGTTHAKMVLIGKQRVRKHRLPSAPVDTVYIIIVLVRLRNVSTDVLLSLNLPASGGAFEEQALNTALLLPGELRPDSILHAWPVVARFRAFLHTFAVQNWNLFG